MRRPSIRSLQPFGLLVFGLVGCFASGSDEPDPIPDRLVALRAATCESIARCQFGGTADGVSLALAGGCELYRVGVDPVRELIARGDLAFDDVELERCIRDLLDCRSGGSDSCRRALTGGAPIGSGCISALECASASCSGDPEAGTCGVCVESWWGETPTLGESCSGQPCADVGEPEAVCAYFEEDGSRCRLQREIPSGEGCFASDAVCERGLTCRSDGVCAGPIPIGSPCALAEVCERGSLCSTNDVELGTCVAIVLGNETDPCSEALPREGTFFGCDAAQGLRCDTTSLRCAKVRSRRRNELCGGFDDCATGLRCDGVRCTSLLDADETCAWNGDCKSGFCADEGLNGHRCRPWPESCD